MIKKILIANRGEIAVRIIRACHEMKIETVAVYSEADKDALHTQMADYAVCIGASKSSESYLNIQNIISAAILTGCDAIHPGFGFLSENSMFANICEDCKIKFIGPSAATIDLMGNKANAKALMKSAGVPIIPDSGGLVETFEDVVEFTKKFGFPVIIKASAGGGGRGIRIVRSFDQLESSYLSAKAEAKAAFNDDAVYMEKLIENSRHIEVQILADSHGNCIHLGERDCSMQRRNQKVLEEAPSPAVSEKLRKKMGDASVKAAKAANYENAGTIEYLVDKLGNFYFMEMNTRIQVEHPITEAVSGVDIVKEQIRIASGMPLSKKQHEIKISGHAIECRINAEDPENNFAASPGTVSYLLLPSGGLGLRVDSAIFAGYKIPPFYDSMIAKVITHGEDREQAILKMKRALSEFVITGVKTNIEFQLELISKEAFNKGEFDTGFISREFKQ